MSWKNGVLWGVVCTVCIITGCSDSSKPLPVVSGPVATGTVGGGGGVVEAPASGPLAGTRIEIPAGALPSTQTIEIYSIVEALAVPAGRTAYASPLRLTPESLSLSKPATLALVRQSTGSDSQAVIYRETSGAWAPILPTTKTGDVVTAKIDRLGVYAAFAGLPADQGGTVFDPSHGKLGADAHPGDAFGECAFVQWFWTTKTQGNPATALMDWTPVGSLHSEIADSAQTIMSNGPFDYSDPERWSRYVAPDPAIALGLLVALRQSRAEPQLLGVLHPEGAGVPDAVLVYSAPSTNPLVFNVYDPYATGEKSSTLTFDGQTLTLGSYTGELRFAHLYQYIPPGSGLSRIYDHFSGEDTTPPARIDNLTATAVGTDAIGLAWTAPGDDQRSGTASAYSIKYSTTAPDDDPNWWENATVMAGAPAPQVAGAAESLTVTGLTACEEYHFGIKASDEVPNQQPECSNTPSATPFCGNCAAAITEARAALEQEAYKHRRPGAPSPESPDDVDFSAAKEHYREALSLCPAGTSASREAHFGLALTGLLTLSMDPEINAAFDEWKEFLEEGGPFSVDSSPGQPLGVPLMLDESANPVRMPIDLVLASALRWARAATLEADPRVSVVQQVLIDRVIPTAQEVLTHLDQVAADRDFIFWVTPMMQGDPDADSDEIDQTDVLLLSAACHLLMAGCHVTVAYDLSVASYDEAGIHAALDPGTGTMVRLRPDGADHMRAVLPDARAAVDRLDEAITALLAETDDQSNDVVKIGPRDLDRADVIEFQNLHLPKIAAALYGPTSYTRDWDNNPRTPDATMTVDINAFFSNPVNDFKELAPRYTIQTQRRGWGTTEAFRVTEDMLTAPINIPVSRYYQGCAGLSLRDFEEDDGPAFPSCDPLLGTAMSQAIAGSSWLQPILSRPDWDGNLSVTASFWGELAAGMQQVPFQVSVSYETAEWIVNIPVVVWDADTYEEWTDGFPDPTLNGLLPATTSVRQYLGMFDPTGWSDWEKRIKLEWTELNWMD